MNVQSKTDGRQGHFQLSGGRVGFLLMHGLGGTPAELRFVGQGLNRAGYSVLCPQLAGHGGSDLLLNTTTWQDWLQTAEDALDELKRNCDHVIAGGLSAGSILSLHLAARRKADIGGLVLFSPTFWPNGWATPWYSILFRLIRHKAVAHLFRTKIHAPYGIKDERIRRFVLESLQSEGRQFRDVFGRPGGTVWEFKTMAAAAKKLLADIDIPALICHSRQDDQSDLSNAFMLQRKLRGHVEMSVLSDCYHMITLDRQRSRIVDRTIAFAESLSFDLQLGGEQAGGVAGFPVSTIHPGPRSA